MASKATGVQWYVSLNGDQKGPLSTAQLKRWIKERRIDRHTFVRRGPDGQWMLLGELRLGKDWQARLNGVVAVAGIALAIEALVVGISWPAAALWGIALLAAYVGGVVWAYGLPSKREKKQ
jgi:hypothetical protein